MADSGFGGQMGQLVWQPLFLHPHPLWDSKLWEVHPSFRTSLGGGPTGSELLSPSLLPWCSTVAETEALAGDFGWTLSFVIYSACGTQTSGEGPRREGPPGLQKAGYRGLRTSQGLVFGR